MSRKSVTISLTLITDPNLSTTAKVIYAVLKSFQSGKSGSLSAPSVIASHKEITNRSNLSQNTVVKCLNKLESVGWITRERTAGLPNTYVFTTPLTQFNGDDGRVK
jgi:DNA-binding MarR family transcriptional regulator